MIHTDHRSLIHLNEQCLHTPWQQKVFTTLLGLRYKVVYRKGSENQAADALSRRDQPEQLNAVSAPVHTWLAQLQQWYPTDPEAKSLLAQLSVDASSHPPYQLKDGIIFYQNRIWLGSNSDLKQKVLSALHASPVSGHSGAPATFQKLRPLFFWPGMRADVLKFVQSCATCAQTKPDRAGHHGLLQPIPVPRQSWEVISLDFVEGLPMSGSVNAILVVVDKYSKFAHFVPL